MKTAIAFGLTITFLVLALILRDTHHATRSTQYESFAPTGREEMARSVWSAPACRRFQKREQAPVLQTLRATLDSLLADTSPNAAEQRQLLVRCWAETDPAAAAAWAAQLPAGAARREAFQQVALAWANADLSSAVRWVNGLPDGENKQIAALGLAGEAARADPIIALETAGALPPGLERDELLVHAVSQWAASDSAAAAAWAMNVPDAGLKQRLIAAIAVASAEKDGPAAATLAANFLVPGEEQDRAAVAIVQRWAQSSPQAAAAWVAQFADSPARAAAVEWLSSELTAKNAKNTESSENW